MFCKNCGTQLADDAVFCAKCGSKTAADSPPPLPATGAPPPLPAAAPRAAANEDASLKWLLPVGRSPFAIVAGYLGLFSVLLVPAPFALLFGILGLRDIKKNPRLGGRGRSWFGIIAGAFFTTALLLSIAATIGTAIGARD